MISVADETDGFVDLDGNLDVGDESATEVGSLSDILEAEEGQLVLRTHHGLTNLENIAAVEIDTVSVADTAVDAAYDSPDGQSSVIRV